MDKDDKATRIRPRPTNASNNNDATVIRSPAQRPKPSASEPAQPSRAEAQTGYSPSTEKIKDDEVALTRINNAFQSQDTSRGFERARNDANEALHSNKIILNKRFVLESTLGSGGMGTVYRAQDLRKVEANDLKPYVAVKVLNTDFQNHPDAFVTLQREASRSHTLSHPNIITVHDFDRDGNVFYMTMELLEGQGLEVVLRNAKDVGLPVDEALSIINDYCTALEYAHQKNIIHSDIKPGNIFISKTGAKVLDFGIARFTAESQVKNDFDAGSLGAMTPAYASLEMLQYKPPTPSDDVFAAAVIAYELFTGTHPYNRKSADQALAEKLKPKRIDGLSKRQWKALSNALQLKGSDRTPSVQQFLDELLLKKKVPIFKITSLIFLIALSWFGYEMYFVPNELTTVLNKTLSKAKECYAAKNYNCAIDSSKAVLKMEANHKEASVLLKKSEADLLSLNINTLNAAAIKCIEEKTDLNCANKKLQRLINIAAGASEVEQLKQRIAAKQTELFISRKMKAANSCMSQKQYSCAVQNADEILAIDASHQPAKQLADSARSKISQQQQATSKNNKIFNTRLKKANACFTRKNYECASKNAKLALQNKPGNSKAETLYQKSNYAMIRQAENLERANNVLKQGQQCFERKNYSCSIAKSESALEFVPGHKGAIRLKNKAKNEIKKLKQSLIIN
ncbi:Serine/threonine protein kinase [hydrothermal vent metagenome]|uniref:Serine/threonine protein kinase n=1 Tax=hydrothermal vent metagenome TaxID=652676 RepID=A0A3B0YJG6_9ZZZZ